MSLEFEQRLSRLEKHDWQAEQAAISDTSQVAWREARFAALETLVQELAVREGLSKEQFAKHYEERARFFHDRCLRIAEDIDPSMAGRIDVRGPADMPEGESYPPL